MNQCIGSINMVLTTILLSALETHSLILRPSETKNKKLKKKNLEEGRRKRKEKREKLK